MTERPEARYTEAGIYYAFVAGAQFALKSKPSLAQIAHAADRYAVRLRGDRTPVAPLLSSDGAV